MRDPQSLCSSLEVEVILIGILVVSLQATIDNDIVKGAAKAAPNVSIVNTSHSESHGLLL
jgi:hypothetical protein